MIIRNPQSDNLKSRSSGYNRLLTTADAYRRIWDLIRSELGLFLNVSVNN